MIEALVDIFSGLIQLLIVVLIAGGAYLGYLGIPDSVNLDGELVEIIPFFKILIGGGISLLLASFFLAPALILLDVRNSIRSIDEKTK